jgi:NADH-quinone oxidoreductase subunit N
MYLIIELQSLASYVLSSFKRDSEFAAEAGLKYFVFGAVISCFFLLGFSCVYFTFGSLSFELLFSILFDCFDFRSTLGIFFILIGLLFKLGAAPFHL